MARIRSVKPGLRTSLTVAEWPRDVRYLWVLLWGYLDDYGRGVDDARLVKADCLPLDDDVTRHTVEDWLSLIAKSGPLCRYQVAGRRYMHAPNWPEHQKPSHPKDSEIPPCPFHDLGQPLDDPPESLAKPSGEPRETLRPEVEVEKGDVVRGGDGTPPPAANARKRANVSDPTTFERFWDTYPRKEAKGAARKAWDKATRTTNPQVIIDAAARYRAHPGRDPRYTPHPATWLNSERWTDQPIDARASPSNVVALRDQPRPSTTDQRVAAVLALADEFPQAEGGPA